MGNLLHALTSGLILGFTGFTLGFFGSLILSPNNNQGPLLGIFITGPAGLIIGAILGFVIGKNTIWKRTLWFCSILSLIIIVFGVIYLPWYSSKHSSIVEKSSDLQKRDKALTSLHVRSLSDDEISNLRQFPNLNYIDYQSGWAVEEAKLTDVGLKNILQLNLPQLEWLMLGYCNKITNAGMQYVAQITTLKHLSLVSCSRISDEGLSYLTASHSIETLDLSDCNGITDKGLGYLQKMKSLKEISLGGCRNISRAGVQALRNALPNCKVEYMIGNG